MKFLRNIYEAVGFSLVFSVILLTGCRKEPLPNSTEIASISEASALSEESDVTGSSLSDEPDELYLSDAEDESAIDENTEETGNDNSEPGAEIRDKIPVKYINLNFKDCGTNEQITYTSHDYFGNGSEIEKTANVYLPYGYDSSQKYNVLYLMHGIGGDENEWGLNDPTSRTRAILDNLFRFNDVEPFIVVTPNGRSALDHSKDSDYNSFYLFGSELRYDLIPYIEKNYSTYAEFDDNEFPINFFYNICGLQDSVAYQSHRTAAKNLPYVCDSFTENENYMWQEVGGGHDFNVWHLGLYNFSQIVFRNDE